MNSVIPILLVILLIILIFILTKNSNCKNNDSFNYTLPFSGGLVEEDAESLPLGGGKVLPNAISLPFSGGQILTNGYADMNDNLL